MEHYNTNIKNRKLKKKILSFLSRLGFGAGKLPFSGRFILVLSIILLCTLFFPWIEITSLHKEVSYYGAFSRYTGFIGIGILIAAIIIPFFLLSHTKKEHIRAYVPFHLSDTQAVVFVATMILVAIIQLIIISGTYTSIGNVELKIGFGIAGSSVILIIICGYFLSRKIKSENTKAYYLNHETKNDLGEYTNIIHPNENTINEKKKENMSLPI